MASTEDVYTYEGLSEPGQIRLLHLKPGTGDIHFTLVTVQLDEDPPYEAISYCWGDAQDTRVVFCHGKPINITNSLFTALRQLRKPDEIRILWADAVCINQTSTEEKTEQVKLMGRIYSQPSLILIWLGEDVSGLDGLETCLQGAHDLLPPSSHDGEVLQSAAKKAFWEASNLRREKKPNFNDHDWAPFANILCRPWFERKWVIQEVVLAPDNVERLVVCGKFEFSWNAIADIAYRITAHGLGMSLSGTSVINARAPSMMHFLQQNSRPMIMLQSACMITMLQHYKTSTTIVDAVMGASTFKCTDPRDHLYALLGLVSRVSGLKPDYHLTDSEVFSELAEAVFVGDQNLRLLSLAPHMTFAVGDLEAKRIAGLPSWVPDLSCQASFISAPLASYTIRPQLFHAGGKSPDRPVRTSKAGNGRRLLHLRGRIIDTIETLGRCLSDAPLPTVEDIVPKTGYSALFKMYMRNWIRECQVVAFGSSAVSITSVESNDEEGTAGPEVTVLASPWSDEFARTLLCSMTVMRDAAPLEAIPAVRDYVTYLEAYFVPGWKLTDSFRERMLTYSPLVEQSVGGQAAVRKLCRTRGGRLGQVRKEAREGDLVCVLTGAEVPYILRRSDSDDRTWTLVGDAYISGVMQGEALADERYETIDVVIE